MQPCWATAKQHADLPHGIRQLRAAYNTQFADWNMVSSIGGFCFGASQILFPIIIWQCARGGERATGRVWEGARGLEWELPSPAPYHSWTEAPTAADLERGTPLHQIHG